MASERPDGTSVRDLERDLGFIAALVGEAACKAIRGERPTAEGTPAPRCRLTVTKTEGCEPRDVEVLIAPVRTRVENCRRTSGGKLSIRIRRDAGRLTFEVAPGSSLDPTERQCILDALSTIRDGESSTDWSGGNARPTGFTSLITLEW